MRGPRAFAAVGSSLVLAGAFGGLATASAAEAGSGDSTWTLDCTWTGASGQPSVPAAAVTVNVSAPTTIKPGESADVVAKFKDGAVLTLPPSSAARTYKSASLTFAVTGGPSVTQLVLAGPEGSTSISSNTIQEPGNLTATLPIPEAGWRSLTLAKLTLSLGGQDAQTLGLVCTPESPVPVSLTVKAVADTPTPTASQSPSPATTVLTQTVQAGLPGDTSTSPSATDTSSITTGGGTSTTGGNLAHTGSGGDGLKALAMLAGTALLGAIAVLLTTPARRRNRAERKGA
jgi:hypothetical protein